MNEKAFYNNIERYFIIILFMGMTVITATTVLTRFCFNYTLSWAEQLSRFLLVWISFAGISWAGKIDVHMRVTAVSLLTKKHPWFFKVILLIGDFISVIYSLYLTYRIYLFMLMVKKQGQILSSLPWIPKWVMYLAGVLGMTGLAIRIIQRRTIWFLEKKNRIFKGETL